MNYKERVRKFLSQFLSKDVWLTFEELSQSIPQNVFSHSEYTLRELLMRLDRRGEIAIHKKANKWFYSAVGGVSFYQWEEDRSNVTPTGEWKPSKADREWMEMHSAFVAMGKRVRDMGGHFEDLYSH